MDHSPAYGKKCGASLCHINKLVTAADAAAAAVAVEAAAAKVGKRQHQPTQ